MPYAGDIKRTASASPDGLVLLKRKNDGGKLELLRCVQVPILNDLSDLADVDHPWLVFRLILAILACSAWYRNPPVAWLSSNPRPNQEAQSLISPNPDAALCASPIKSCEALTIFRLLMPLILVDNV